MENPHPGIVLTSEIKVSPVQSVGGDHMVAAAARVSTSGADALSLASPEMAGEVGGLINYLMKHRHGTPFEHASLTVFVSAPAFVWWEWVRHRVGFSYNLESGRYKALDPVFYVPPRDRPMMRPPCFKPARPAFDRASDWEYEAVVYELTAAYNVAWQRYSAMIEGGVATELARACLPFAVYYSGWVTCNPRSLMSFLSLRTKEESATFPSYPQHEIEVAARSLEDIFKAGWPLTYEAFNKNGRVAP